MKVALGSDERTALTDAVAADLASRGHEVAHEMLDAWFTTEPDPSERENLARLEPS